MKTFQAANRLNEPKRKWQTVMMDKDV